MKEIALSFLVEIIDIDVYPERIPANVMGVPTVILYDGNVEKARFSGAKNKHDLQEWITVNAA
jgi:hypothetical protein